jgi:hypothetical protein
MYLMEIMLIFSICDFEEWMTLKKVTECKNMPIVLKIISLNLLYVEI